VVKFLKKGEEGKGRMNLKKSSSIKVTKSSEI
jgi:hypothetical protein